VPAVSPAVPAVSPAVPAVSPAVPAVSPAVPAVSPAVPAVSLAIPKAKLSTQTSRESLAKEWEEEIRSLRETCHMNIRHVYLDNNNDASFNIFIIFISRMQNLMKLISSSLESIAQMLCTIRINIGDSLKYLNELLLSADKAPMLYTRNYENVFKLLKLVEPAKDQILLSDRVYALDELGFNLILLAAASTILFPANEPYDSIHKTLSDILYKYQPPSVDIRTYYLRSFFKYLEKFRISEVLVPSQNNFYFIERVEYSLVGNKIKFKNNHIESESLSQVTALPPKEKPMYIVITFYSENPKAGARGIDSFKLQGYKINSIILKKRSAIPDFTLLSMTGDEVLCLITEGRIRGTALESFLYKKQETLLKTIEEIDGRRGGIPLLSYDIIAVLYELEKSGASNLPSEEIIPINPIINIQDFNSKMREKKEKFRDLVMKKFLDKFLSEFSKLQIKGTDIFKLLEFMKLSTGSIEKYDGVITRYLFVKGDPRDAKIFIAPFVEKVVNNFFRTEFDLTLSEKSTEEIWNNILEETEFYTHYHTMTIEMSLRNAVKNTMRLFTVILHNAFPFKDLQKKDHCDYILATIHLIKRLWKVYDECIAVMKLLLEKKTTPDVQKKLLHYLLLKFNKLIYVKCYFASFSNNAEKNQKLEKKRAREKFGSL
jgi:hypothetical protein